MTPTAVLLSYRLGGTDGVSIEAAKWERALQNLGFTIRRVAGEFPDRGRRDDVLLAWLARESGANPIASELDAALDGADLVVVENLCSLPLNVAAARTAAAVLRDRGGRIVFHHHDLPWQRDEYASVTDLPPDFDGVLHLTINDRSRRELAERGIEAVTIYNTFDADAPRGDRNGTRAAFAFAPSELVVLQPTRAIRRKDVPAGVRFAHDLQRARPEWAVRFWLTGPAEDGYEPALERIVATAPVAVTVGRAPTGADAYAAADVVVLPSTWEGFGNPVVESVIAGRPLAAAPYPVLAEVTALGFRFFSVDDPGAVVAWLEAPDHDLLDANLALARRHFSLTRLPQRLAEVFASVGWSGW